MLKYLKAVTASSTLIVMASVAQAGDVDAGAKVFKKCAACHAVGDGAKNRVGPHLNDLFERTAASIDGFKYSKAMKAAGEEGLAWNDETLTAYLAAPKKYLKGTKMAFPGLKKEADLENIIAYLKTFDANSNVGGNEETDGGEDKQAASDKETAPKSIAATPALEGKKSQGKFGLGRLATEVEVKAWDIDIRPDGLGLPVGSGTVAQGEPIYSEQCAACHGDFGEAVDRWPVLAGGQDTLTDERPVKTIGSYWPHLSTVYDYIRRAMPFGNARSLNDNEYYALTAYMLYLNDIVDDEEFELSNENFNEVVMPNAGNFIPDSRLEEAHYSEKKEPCMENCKDGPVKITMTARVLDVTPESGEEPEGGGAID